MLIISICEKKANPALYNIPSQIIKCGIAARYFYDFTPSFFSIFLTLASSPTNSNLVGYQRLI